MVSVYDGAVRKCKDCKSEGRNLNRKACCFYYSCFPCLLISAAKHKT